MFHSLILGNFLPYSEKSNPKHKNLHSFQPSFLPTTYSSTSIEEIVPYFI